MQNTELNAGIIIAVISLVGSLATVIVQFLRDRAQIAKEREALKEEVKRDELTTIGNLADIALKLNRQEIDTLRQIVVDLKERTKYLEDELTDCQVDSQKKFAETADLINLYRDKIRTLEEKLSNIK
jgi:hypothetical protein